MPSEADQTLYAIGEGVTDDTKTASGAESDVPMSSSSSNVVAEKMANKDTLMLFNYWKKSTVTKEDCSAHHTVGWLGGEL
jgi:hypothetical protein